MFHEMVVSSCLWAFAALSFKSQHQHFLSVRMDMEQVVFAKLCNQVLPLKIFKVFIFGDGIGRPWAIAASG